jgi:hypothetical protein
LTARTALREFRAKEWLHVGGVGGIPSVGLHIVLAQSLPQELT